MRSSRRFRRFFEQGVAQKSKISMLEELRSVVTVFVAVFDGTAAKLKKDSL